MKKRKTSFQESGWQFEFDDIWWVKKFDDHRYYRSLSGSGFKGLDFIAVKPGSQLLLIEVKNYRDQEPPESEQLGKVFIEKVEDSLKLLELVQKYYGRKWFFRLFAPWIKRYPTFFGEQGYWTEAFDLAQSTKVCAVLWLDAPVAPLGYIEKTNHFIQEQMTSVIPFSLEPFNGLSQQLGFRIRRCCLQSRDLLNT